MYSPREDSFFLSKTLEKFLGHKPRDLKILDMGSGSGIQAETCLKLGFKNILAADIDTEALKFLKKKKIPVTRSDLFSNIKGKFDVIIFNPPYLPDSKYDKEKDTSGGKKGDETIIKFLEQAVRHLNNDGEIILLLSSFTPKKRITSIIKNNYKKELLKKKKIFFETLEIWLLRKN